MVKAKQAAQAIGAITVIGFASKVLGFVREMVWFTTTGQCGGLHPL